MTHSIYSAFGFIADLTKSTRENAATYLANMTVGDYFNRPTNMAFHELTSYLSPPKNLRSLLGLGLKFILNSCRNILWSDFAVKTLPRFNRDL